MRLRLNLGTLGLALLVVAGNLLHEAWRTFPTPIERLCALALSIAVMAFTDPLLAKRRS